MVEVVGYGTAVCQGLAGDKLSPSQSGCNSRTVLLQTKDEDCEIGRFLQIEMARKRGSSMVVSNKVLKMLDFPRHTWNEACHQLIGQRH